MIDHPPPRIELIISITCHVNYGQTSLCRASKRVKHAPAVRWAAGKRHPTSRRLRALIAVAAAATDTHKSTLFFSLPWLEKVSVVFFEYAPAPNEYGRGALELNYTMNLLPAVY